MKLQAIANIFNGRTSIVHNAGTDKEKLCFSDGQGGEIPLTEDEIKKVNVEYDKLKTANDALAWSRNREKDYPSFYELTIALYDTDDKAALETKRAAVKTKWPKDNSGPVE